MVQKSIWLAMLPDGQDKRVSLNPIRLREKNMKAA